MIAIILAALVLIACCPGCSASRGKQADNGGLEGPAGSAQNDAAINAVVSFDALYELAAAIGGERVSVVNVMPPGAEAHHFEPSARDLSMLNTADVFIICGLGLEPWAEKAVSAAGNSKLIVCDASRGITPISLADDEDSEHHDSGGDHEHELFDPHVWLSPKCAAVMAENIRDAFAGADPAGAEYYKNNCNEFARRLEGIFKEYSEKFSAVENSTIVTGHAVFAYLCRDYGLTQNSVEGVFAEGEPGARALAELIDFCRQNDIRAILTESLSSPLVAETLAAEAGARVLVVYTMESAEDGLSYLARLEHNLATIYESLC